MGPFPCQLLQFVFHTPLRSPPVKKATNLGVPDAAAITSGGAAEVVFPINANVTAAAE
jgi:hypothetical protein